MRTNRRFRPRVDGLPERLAPTIFPPPPIPPLAPQPLPEPDPPNPFWEGLEAARIALKNSTPLGLAYDYFFPDAK